jgi:PBP1b-binding outer membrane lipoprotein LpoB
LESQDVVSITDRMVRDILATPEIGNRTVPPRIVIDGSFFRNESSSIVNKSMLTDRLRVELARAAGVRLVFLARHQARMTEEERALEKAQVVTEGTQGPTSLALGYDYRLGGRITSIDAVNSRSGMQSRYHLIAFELVERGSGRIVWTNSYEFKKSALDDVVYR